MQRRMIDIGALNKRLTFYAPDPDAVDEMGQTVNGMKEIATVWGSLYPVRGQEFYEAKKVQSRVTHKCYVRYRDALVELDSNCYVKCGETIYTIESAVDLETEHKFIEIYCSEHINKEAIV